MALCNILHVSNIWIMLLAVIMGDFLSGDQEVTMDDKSAVKAKGLWEDWHMRQAVDQAVRANHRSGIHYPNSYSYICFLTEACNQ